MTWTNEQRRAYQRQYYHAHKGPVSESKREYNRAYYQAHKADTLKYRKQYYQTNKERIRATNSKWEREHRDKTNQMKAKYRNNLRLAAIEYYGGRCACCGETNNVFLCIDHINNNGAKHRKEIGSKLCQWLKTNNYPDGFQVLCWNCNSAKYLLGTCPHQTKEK